MNEEIKKYILNNSHKSTRLLEKETGVCRNSISKLLKENGINKDNRLTEKEKEFILNNSKLEYKEIAHIINKPITTVKGFLNRNGYYKQVKFSPNREEFIFNYNKNTMKNLCEIYSVDKKTILKYIDSNNIMRKSELFKIKRLNKIKYKKLNRPNYNYFSNIDTEQKAYYLGLIASDGSVSDRSKRYKNSQNTLQITLKFNDGYILEYFHKELNTNRVCYINSVKNTRTFQIASNKICDDLSSYGIIFNKTWNMNIVSVPYKFIPSFLLGYFDGDGSIYINKNKDTISSTNISISGTESSIKSIRYFLDLLSLKYSIIQDKRYNKYSGSFYSIVFKNTTEKYCFLKTIYFANCICLNRKKNLALKLIEKIESNSTNRIENIKAINNYLNMPFIMETL